MTALLSADLVGDVSGHEILVSTRDGLLMALTVAPSTTPGGRRQQRRGGGGENGGAAAASDDRNFISINDAAALMNERRRHYGIDDSSSSSIPAWESEVPGGAVFAFSEPAPAIGVKDWTRTRIHVMGEVFTVAFDIGEAATQSGNDDLLRVKVSASTRVRPRLRARVNLYVSVCACI